MDALMSEFKAMAITSFGDTGDGAIRESRSDLDCTAPFLDLAVRSFRRRDSH